LNQEESKVPDKFSTFDKGGVAGVGESHPSFGTFSIGRVSGNTTLFDSTVRHHHFIKISIHPATKYRDGAQERVFGKSETLAEVWMTEAQFAQAISQPNVGSGVACTLRYFQGDEPYEGVRWGRPMPPEDDQFLVKFTGEAKKYTDQATAAVDEANETLKKLLSGELKPTKANLGAAVKQLESARRQVNNNLPYALKQAQEGIEDAYSKAVVNFEAYVGQSLQARGMQHLTGTTPELPTYKQKALDKPEEDRYTEFIEGSD
jgi:hypothetical protein